MSVQKQSIVEFINRFSGTCYSLLLVGFLGLALINSQFNFDLPKNAKIRDIADFSLDATEIEKLSLDRTAPELATSFASSVPRTSHPSTAPARVYGGSYAAFEGGIFTIHNPDPVSTPAVDAGAGVKKYGDKFLYAHSDAPRGFNGLKSVAEGSTIAVETGGITELYRVSKVVRGMSKSDLNSNSTLRYAIYNAKSGIYSYSLALMTCGDGTNNDGNLRTVYFLSKL